MNIHIEAIYVYLSKTIFAFHLKNVYKIEDTYMDHKGNTSIHTSESLCYIIIIFVSHA